MPEPAPIIFYTFPGPNGVKISAALAETGLAHIRHVLDLDAGDHRSPEFLKVNPMGQIPAIVDPNGPDGAQVVLSESGAILVYLAGKTGMLLPDDAAGRYDVLQ